MCLGCGTPAPPRAPATLRTALTAPKVIRACVTNATQEAELRRRYQGYTVQRVVKGTTVFLSFFR